MVKRIASVVIPLLVVCGVAFNAAGQTAEPWLGTWQVNLAKSIYSPGPKPTMPATVKMEAAEGGLKTTIDAANQQGQPTHTEMMGKFDGTDSPVKGAPAPNSTQALKRIDARSFETVGKVDGKVTVTTRVTVSSDGKTLTATQTGKSPQGETINNVIVAEKQ